MSKVQIATRIDAELKTALERHCADKGTKIGHFLSEAIIDRLEELEDASDVVALRREPTESWEALVAELHLRESQQVG